MRNREDDTKLTNTTVKLEFREHTHSIYTL